MNADNEAPTNSNDDRLLEELLAPLKRLEPPQESRLANRQAIYAALSQLRAVNEQRHLPWWRRSVSVPVPLAAALGLLLAIALVASVRSSRKPSDAIVTVPRQPTQKLATQPSKDSPTFKHYETETYLCGVGRVSSEAFYALED